MKEATTSTVFQVTPKSSRTFKQPSVTKNMTVKSVVDVTDNECVQLTENSVECVNRKITLQQSALSVKRNFMSYKECPENELLYVESVTMEKNAVRENSWNKVLKMYVSENYFDVRYKLDTVVIQIFKILLLCGVINT